jgi:hypothetical protein
MKELLYTPAQLEGVPMAVLAEHAYEGTPFVLKSVKYPEDTAGHWPTTALLVYRNGVLLGGYRRMYPSFAIATFMPFCWQGQWYALYSANYTCTRVLRLDESSLEDWCGEAPASCGFCPTEFFAPQRFVADFGDNSVQSLYEKVTYATYAEFLADATDHDGKLDYPGFAFLSGCIWGDDSAWKLRYIDYSKVTEKVLVIDERFGYHPLPPRPLAQCVDLSCWEPNFPIIRTSKQEQFCFQ